MPTTEPWVRITYAQLKRGYVEKRGEMTYTRAYTVIRKNADGTYIVRNPVLEMEEHKLREASDE